MSLEPQPIGTFKTEHVVNPALEEMSLEQLSDLIKWPSKMEKFVAASSETAPLPEPEVTESEPEASPVTEPEAKATEQAAPVVEEAPSVAEPTQEDVERELLELRLSAAEAQAKKFEARLLGREAGASGYVKQLKDRIAQLEAGASPESQPAYSEEVQAEPQRAPAQRSNLNAWAVQQASREAVNNFTASHPGVDKVEQEILAYLNSSGFDAGAIAQYDDPIAAGRELTRGLEEAYWHVEASRKQARVTELQAKRADQVKNLAALKVKATSSASGSLPPAPKPRRATADLSLEELEAKMRAFTRR